MTLEQLRKALAGKVARMEEINKGAVNDKGDVRALTESEDKEYKELEASAKVTKEQIRRVEELQESRSIVERLNEPASTATSIQVTRAENHNEKGQYRGFKSFGEQLQSIHRAASSINVDKRLHEVRAAAGLNEANDSEGGFLVQSDFIVDLKKSMMENADLPKHCARLPIGPNSNGSSEPMSAETSRADGSRAGGVQAYWEGEADVITKSKPTFDNLELKLKKLTALCVATDEQLQDAVQLGAYIREVFADEMGFKLDAGIIEGLGVGMPLGFKNSPALVTVTKKSGQTADTVVAENITAMFAAMHKRGKSKGLWLVNAEVWGQLPVMAIGNSPVFLPQGSMVGVPHATLLGRPVIECEACEKLGDKGDIYFVDLGQYRLIEKGGIEEAQSMHVYFDTAQQAFRFIVRKNGAPRLKTAITPYKANSGFKVSAFVTVENRT